MSSNTAKSARIESLALGLLIAFLITAVALFYWAVVRAPQLAARRRDASPRCPGRCRRPAARGQTVFNGKAMCATCHVPPLYSEPGHKLHKGAAIGIDNFHADRSPTGAYRTTPLKGLFTREKGGFYHDGRFHDYDAVINHYKPVLGFELSGSEQSDLVQFLKSL